MKKINHKIGLCVGLLSLTTFSSCLHTKQEMNRPTVGNAKRHYNRHQKKYIIGGVCAGLLATAGLSGGGTYCYLNGCFETKDKNPEVITPSPNLTKSGNDIMIPPTPGSPNNYTTGSNYSDNAQNNSYRNSRPPEASKDNKTDVGGTTENPKAQQRNTSGTTKANSTEKPDANGTTKANSTEKPDANGTTKANSTEKSDANGTTKANSTEKSDANGKNEDPKA
ncbi:hypothetical protein ACRRVB_03005 [Candidatus Cardinium hertigii]|uniref:hypothetical protein n=1 Tax=Candidatus Cardinium hertigii TaxID=247481 RepID=UPI003D7D3D2F